MIAKRTGWPPRWLTKTTPAERHRGDGEYCADFIDSMCRITMDTIAGDVGDPLELRAWQRELLRALLARRVDGRYKHRVALIGMPRKNGKSALASSFALWSLLEGPAGGQIIGCAAEKEQARIVFGVAKSMVELEPELSEAISPYKDVLEVKTTGSVYRCVSAEAYSKEGLNPHLVIFDEVHAQPNRELWDVMRLAQGARREPLMLGITTAGVRTDASGGESLCYEQYQKGRDLVRGHATDPTFFFAWWEPKAGVKADHRDPQVWAECNPGFDDIVARDDFVSVLADAHENEFRTKRTNVFTSDVVAWLPHGAWEACADRKRSIPDGAHVVLGFDGSFNNDSTALVACLIPDRSMTARSAQARLHLEVVECWEPKGQPVAILDVEEAIRSACRRWRVKEVTCDPFRWARSIQVLEAERIPMVEFPQSPSRMVPATQRFYEAVLNRSLTHSGEQVLARHIGNAVLRTDSRGSRLSKESKGSPRRIDLAVAAVMAVERAAYWAGRGRPQVVDLAAALQRDRHRQAVSVE